jgi:hypothetical protein
MRLTTWNCKGGFHRKHGAIATLGADVLVLPECGRLSAVNNVLGAAPVRSFEWVGENPRKGLGVVSYGDYFVTVHPAYDPTFRWVLPVDVNGPVSFLLLAVWTVPDPSDGVYVHFLFRALTAYADLIRHRPTIVAGDFNQSVRFDKPGSPLNFAEWLVAADGLGLRSVYHEHRTCAHGGEPEPTFYLQHAQGKPHHIDFVFASQSLMEMVGDVGVGVHSEWAALSDHMPLHCTFNPVACDN